MINRLNVMSNLTFASFPMGGVTVTIVVLKA